MFYHVVVDVSASEISKFAENFRTSCGCVIKTIEPQSTATVDDLSTVVSRVNSLEEGQRISFWDEEHIPEEIVGAKPTSG